MNKNREKVIIRTSIIGISANVLLSVFKAIVGILSNSIAIVLDSVNNLSDALSSIITIIGTKLANKKPDKKHPYGYGRIEYLTAMIISIIILYAGITSLTESIRKIILPETPSYSISSIIILTVAVVIKILLGLYVKSKGNEVNSSSLVNSGQDALMDSTISFATLVAASIYLLFNISTEAYLGVIISLVIIKSGFDMLKETISQILGERVDLELSKNIKNTILKNKKVKGVFDLILNNYGPDNYLGSVHIEVNDTLTATEIDKITREITEDVYKKHNVILSAVGIYTQNTGDREAKYIKKKINEIIRSYSEIIQMHGFYINKKEKTISFDIIIDFETKEREKVYLNLYNDIHNLYSDYKLNITVDSDVSD